MRLTALIILSAWTVAAQGDILHLRDGSRYSGTLISQNEHEVFFRVVVGDGSSSVLKRFPAELVKTIERGPLHVRLPATSGTAAPETQPVQDFEQMLREAFELSDDQDVHAALQALQKAVLGATPPALSQLDQQCRRQRGVPLAEWLADLRIRGALRVGGGFWIRYATPYEAPVLGARLEQRCNELLAGQYHGRSLAEWAAQPADYRELHRDARAMVTDTRRAAGMLAARLRFDPRLKEDHAARLRQTRLRADLARLIDHVITLPGYTNPLEPDAADNPAAAAARRLAAEQQAASQPSRSPSRPAAADQRGGR
jgi:hypothetical protein